MIRQTVFYLFLLNFSGVFLAKFSIDDTDENTIAGSLSALLEFSLGRINLSVIAWHYEEESGKPQFVTTEIAFPMNPELESLQFLDEFDLDERSNQFRLFEKLGPFVDIGMPVDVFVQYQHDQNEYSKLFYWEPFSKKVYFKSADGFATYNETVEVATQEQIDKFKEELKTRKLLMQPVIVTIDGLTGKTVEITKETLPGPVTYVVDSWLAPEEVLIEAPKLLAEVFFDNTLPEKISEVLTKKFDTKFSGYDWRVLVNPTGHHVSSDTWIEMSFDGFYFYDGKEDIYFVYGFEKETK